MPVLLYTGVLLRLFDGRDPNYSNVRAAIRRIWARRDVPVITPQNCREFWNVSTRPSTARGGFGQTVATTQRRLAGIERICRVLPETPATYEWKRLLDVHSLVGVSVHDAWIVAQMTVWNVSTILTFNPSDFRRYPVIVATTPAEYCQPL